MKKVVKVTKLVVSESVALAVGVAIAYGVSLLIKGL